MKFKVIPLEGVGKIIKFGMMRDEIRYNMSGDFQTFVRGGEWGGGVPVDFYVNHGIFFCYDKSDRLEAIEFSRESNVMLGDLDIFSMKARDVIRYMSGIDREISIESDGATSRKFSLGLWSPDLDENPDAPVESFLAGKPGYYDMVIE